MGSPPEHAVQLNTCIKRQTGSPVQEQNNLVVCIPCSGNSTETEVVCDSFYSQLIIGVYLERHCGHWSLRAAK